MDHIFVLGTTVASHRLFSVSMHVIVKLVYIYCR